MYVKVRLDNDGLPERLEGLALDIRTTLVQRQLRDRMYAAHRRVTAYPALWRGKLPKNWFKSEKQRRYVMMLVKSGRVPYRRTGEYGMRWQVTEIKGGWKLETNTPYAKWVGGDQLGNEQARIHQGRWPVVTTVVDEEMAKLPDEIQQALTFFLRERRLSG